MSIKTETILLKHTAAINCLEGSVAKIEEAVKLLRQEFRAYQRAPTSKSGVKVPPVPLPETLSKLEIGRSPKGT